MVKSCPKTISVLNDPKSQFMTPNLGSWFVFHHGGVSVEPSCFLCGKGLNPSQGLQPLVTGSSSAATSVPSNCKHQVPWPSFSFHIFLKARRSWAGHIGPCVAWSKDPAWAPAARVRGTIRCGWACKWPHRTHGRRRGTSGEARRSGSMVAQDGLVFELRFVVFENPFCSSGCGAVRCLGGIARGPSG